MQGEQQYLVLDYESRSEAPLQKTGAYEYARHPSTRILCASWRIGTKEQLREQLKNGVPAKIWSPAFPNEGDGPQELLYSMADPSVILVAHNAFFEQVITRFVLAPMFKIKNPFMACEILSKLPHERWQCTASFAAALALPRHLEGACLALDLPVKKDMDGRRLMLKYCKPRNPTKKNSAKWHTNARELRRIMQYCQNDVDAETHLFLTVPPLSETERKVWLLDQKINFRGFQTDRDLVGKALKMISEETKHLNNETDLITLGELKSTAQRDGVLAWLERNGVYLPDLKAKTVSDAIKNGLAEGETKRLLEIRQAISKTSTAKYDAFEMRSRSDGRVRDILVYHTASTGRWGGAGVQPQNFPRPLFSQEQIEVALEIIKSEDLELLRVLFGDPMKVFSSCLRSVIVAPENKELFCADYAAIEARVLFWIAKHEEGLKAFRENRPVYEEMAQVIYLIDFIENVTELQRQVGKQAFLGCGFGMGPDKFQATCLNFGMEVDEELARTAVYAYRNTHAPVVKLWSNLERAAIAAVQRKGTKFKINRTTWWVENDFLWCELPSKRRLAYYGPEIKWEPTPWDEKRPKLYHWGVDPYTRKWKFGSTYGGKLTENVVQAVSRDLMANAMLTIEDEGFDIVLSVHDELLAERQLDQGTLDNFEELMASLPAWAGECPVRCKGWKHVRYHK